MCPLLMGNGATEHQIPKPFRPRARTPPILFGGTNSAFSRVRHDLAGIKLVTTHKGTLFRIACRTSIAFSKQSAEAANGISKFSKRRGKLFTISLPRSG
jgi:hypothetical protein